MPDLRQLVGRRKHDPYRAWLAEVSFSAPNGQPLMRRSATQDYEWWA